MATTGKDIELASRSLGLSHVGRQLLVRLASGEVDGVALARLALDHVTRAGDEAGALHARQLLRALDAAQAVPERIHDAPTAAVDYRRAL